MKKLLFVLMLLFSLSFTKSKLVEYGKYHAACIKVVKDTILQSGYIRLDTIVVNKEPNSPTYKLNGDTRLIIRSVVRNDNKVILVLKDTVWSSLKTPEYLNNIKYFESPKAKVKTERNISNLELEDYINKQVVFRPVIIKSKNEKPLTYAEWLKLNP